MKRSGFQKTGMTLVAATLVAFSTPSLFAQGTNAFGQYEMPTGTPVDTQAPPPETQAPPQTQAPPPEAQVPQTQAPPPETQAPPPEMTTAPAMSTTPLSAADMQVVQLAQAKISDGTIITYIQNSGTVYGLDASQIVYLKQQGVSEAVINAMLNQRSAMAAAQQLQQQQQQQQQAQMAPPADQTAIAQPSTPAPTTVVVPSSPTVIYSSSGWGSPGWGWGWSTPVWGWPVGWGWGWGWPGGFVRPGFRSGVFVGGFRGPVVGFHGTVGVGFHGGFRR